MSYSVINTTWIQDDKRRFKTRHALHSVFSHSTSNRHIALVSLYALRYGSNALRKTLHSMKQLSLRSSANRDLRDPRSSAIIWKPALTMPCLTVDAIIGNQAFWAMFIQDRFRSGPKRIQNWTYYFAGPVLDPFGTDSRTVPCKHMDRFLSASPTQFNPGN